MAIQIQFLNRLSEDACHRRKLEQLLCVSASCAGFWLVSSLALADRRGPHRLSHLILLAAFVSLDQPLVSQALALCSGDEAIESRHGVVFDIALVQAERKFIDIAIKMLRAGMMIDADDAALENRENTFHPVCRHGHRGRIHQRCG
jgi:hypothetical protein